MTQMQLETPNPPRNNPHKSTNNKKESKLNGLLFLLIERKWELGTSKPRNQQNHYLPNPIKCIPPNTQVQVPTPQPLQVINPREMLALSLHHSPHSFLTLRHSACQFLRSTTTFMSRAKAPEVPGMRDSRTISTITFKITIEAGATVI